MTTKPRDFMHLVESFTRHHTLRATYTLLAVACAIAGATASASAQQLSVSPHAYILRFTDDAGDVSDMPGVLRQTLTLRLRDVGMGQALREIASMAHIDISYSPSVINLDRRVSVLIADGTVADALRQVLRGEHVDLWVSTNGKMALVPSTSVSTAQATGTVSGQVTDARSGAPLPDATVTISDTRLAAVSGADGTYRIARVPVGPHVIVARRIGYTRLSRSVSVTDGTTIPVDFALAVSATNLSDVVVTGTAGNQTRAAQSAVVSTIDAADVAGKASVSNVTELLQSRVAGVDITTGSGTLGAASRILIRGGASLSLSNDPLIFIDGIRMNSGQRDEIYTGGQTVSPLNDLNPADIESIEVVKGPAAATLYGADASAGVIQIITKKGRLGSRHFTQGITAEYDNISPNFSPDAVYGACSPTQVAPGGPAICQGLSAGAIVHSNPLAEAGVFRNGNLGSLSYNGQGGSDTYSYYVSALVHNEQGTQVNNSLMRRTGRTNFTWSPSSTLTLNANLGIERNDYKLAQSDQSSYAPVILAGLASPTGGFPGSVTGIQNILSEELTLRQTPSVQANYNPFSWFSNRLTIGGDLSNTQATQFFPKNDQGWYHGVQANGFVSSTQDNVSVYTVDYLGNIRTKLGRNGGITSDLSFGSQFINTVDNQVAGQGTGLTTNLSNLVSSAATTLATQVYNQQKSLGYFAQEQVGFGDRLYVQAGVRADRNSSFGNSAGTFWEPKVGASYVISRESFWNRFEPAISSMRLRVSYGTTGRSPPSGAALRTYISRAYLTDAGTLASGVARYSPGDQDLKPETGKEFETGFDAGFFNERAGLELTYYHKVSDNLLVQKPPAPSLGYGISPYVNLGSLLNRGFEFSVRATPVQRHDLTWDFVYNGATNFNRITSLGGVAPFTFSPRRFAPGLSLAEFYVQRVVRVDTVSGVAYVSHAPQPAGNQIPTLTQSVNTTFTLFGNLRIYALFDGKSGFKVENLGQNIRDVSLGNSAAVNLPPGQGGYSAAERLRRTGPFVDVETGAPIPAPAIVDAYIQDGDFVRFRELSATLSLPARFARSLHAAGASITVGGRNLKLWTKFEGWDPEALGIGPGVSGLALFNVDLFTLPQTRRVFTRVNLTF